MLLDNPGWTNGNPLLTTFKGDQTNNFIGKSQALQFQWQGFLQKVADHQSASEPLNDSLHTLNVQAQQWINAMLEDSALADSIAPLLEALHAQSETMTGQFEQADAVFLLQAAGSLDSLRLENSALDESEWHQWCEKRYNEIALTWLDGAIPDSAAIDDLRQIARSCLHYGGRAVLSARGLCEVWLKEHYGEDNCTDAEKNPEERASTHSEEGEQYGLSVLPNPAGNWVQISLSDEAELNQPYQVQATSLNGRMIYTGKIVAGSKLLLSTADWPNGLYLVQVGNGSRLFTKLLLVQHN